jgi:hypothetical protein
MGTDKLVFVEERWGATGSDTVRILDRKRPCPEDTWLFPLLFFPYFPVLFFSYFFFVLFSRIIFFPSFFPYFFLPYYFSVLFFPYFFSPYFSKFATFEIQRFKISVSCFSSTCRYNTVHVPCGIAIQTSPVGLPLDGWGARMRDLKGPKMNLFNLKEDWNVL